MKTVVAKLSVAALFALSPAINAAPVTIIVVNETSDAVSSMSVRKVGTPAWRPVTFTAPVGRPAPAEVDNQDCAFDIQVALANGQKLLFPNVNLCEATRLTLRQRNGTLWVDYD
jgi:hypothetical protein